MQNNLNQYIIWVHLYSNGYSIYAILTMPGSFLGDKTIFFQMYDYHGPLEQMLSVKCLTKF